MLIDSNQLPLIIIILNVQYIIMVIFELCVKKYQGIDF